MKTNDIIYMYKVKRIIVCFVCMLFLLPSAKAVEPVAYTREDSITIVRMLTSLADRQNVACLPLHFARQFLGRPYVASTLELYPDCEQLVVNTRQLDCTTLVENVAALTLCARRQLTTFADYLNVLRQLRYRKGILNGYPSRLHYFSDWIEDNAQSGYVTEISRSSAPFSGVQKIQLNYMSLHPQSYIALKRHPEFIKEIAQQEQALSGRSYHYIPKNQVQNTKALRRIIHDGDILAITCNKSGLDIAHLGFAVWQKDGLHLLNASQIHKKVVLEPMTLYNYLTKHPSHTGIRVVRIEELK